MAEADRETARYSGVLVKASQTFEALERRSPLTASDLAAELDVDRSTAYRLAQALARLGWLRYEEATKHYYLGTRLWELGARAIADLDIRQVARPHMREVVAQTGESCDLAILDGADIVYIEVIEGTREVRAATQLGQRAPAHAVAMGKALLSGLSRTERARILSTDLRIYTPRTVTTLDDFHREADAALERGYATNIGELNPEAGGLAVAIRDASDRIVAAVGINVPTVRMTEDNIRLLAPPLMEAGSAISRQIGRRSI